MIPKLHPPTPKTNGAIGPYGQRRHWSTCSRDVKLGLHSLACSGGCGTLYPGCSPTPALPVLRLKVGRTDVWDTRVRGSAHAIGDQQFDTPRLPIGNLFVAPTHGAAIARIGYRVNLFDANVTGTAFSAGGDALFHFELLVHALEHLIVLDVDPPGAATMYGNTWPARSMAMFECPFPPRSRTCRRNML